MVKDYNKRNGGDLMFCHECRTMLSFDENSGLKICKRCALQNNPDATKKSKKTRKSNKNLESLVLKFEELNAQTKTKYELIFTDTLADLRRLDKSENNYVLCRCHPYDGGPVEKAYISLRYFIQPGDTPKNKIAYVGDVPCNRNCVDFCTFTVAEKNDLVIRKIRLYKEYFKRNIPGAKK